MQPYFDEYGLDASDITPGPERRPFSYDIADILEEFKPDLVSFHFGLPAGELLARVKGWGTTVLASATTLAEAQWLEANGADAIIAQGFEAGGHRGMFLSDDITTQVGTFALLPQVIQQVKVPVIAAGGIADAKSVAAALSLGATAAQVGTAYLLCSETKTSQIHRAALKSEAAGHTVITNLFSGRPARGIINRVIEEIGPINAHTPDYPLAATAMTALRRQADAWIAPEKLTRYLLVLKKRNDKSKWLAQAGYTLDNWQTLERDLRQQILRLDVVSLEENPYGQTYEIRGQLTGPNGQRLATMTVWMTEHATGVTKFITMYPDKGGM